MTHFTLHTKRFLEPLLLIVAAWLFIPGSVFAQNYELSPKSQLQIEGTSSVNSFTCHAKEIHVLQEGVVGLRGADDPSRALTVIVPIRSLDCQNRKMNKDLSRALKSDIYPEILFSVINVDVANESQNATKAKDIYVTGTLDLAGEQRELSFLVSGYLDEQQRLRGKGYIDLLMTAFEIEPPTALFGLIKARNEITIRFHLVAEKSQP